MHIRRILIVDDDEAVRNDLTKTLTRLGGEVTAAVDCDSGLAAYRSGTFDLVILDLVMPCFDSTISRTGGLELLEKIRSTAHGGAKGGVLPAPQAIWILTATADRETRTRALALGAAECLDKADFYGRLSELFPPGNESAEASKKKLGGPIDSQSSSASGVPASRPATSSAGPLLASPKVNQGNLRLRDEEVRLLERLYEDCSQIMLSSLSSSFRTSRVLKVECLDRAGEKTLPFVTKIGGGDDLRMEEEAFRRFVRYKVGAARYAELIATVWSSDGKLGASRMSFVGSELNDVVDFRLFYANHSAEEVCEALESLFERTLGTWHRAKEPARPLDLVPAYDLFGGASRLRERLNNLLKAEKGLHVITLDLCSKPFYEPARALKILMDAYSEKSLDTHLSTIHGDLNVSNILVDGGGDCWLLDFQQTSVGPILRDFIELESSIKYSCLELSPLGLWELEQLVLSQEHFRQEISVKHHHPEIRKALLAVRKIREYAFFAVAPNRDMSEYYFGLLLHTLGMLRFPKRVLQEGTKKVALLASAMIFDFFKEPGQRMGFIPPGDERREGPTRQVEKKTIILVDDDTHLRKDVGKRLERTGLYEILQAEDSKAALELVSAHGKDSALCIVDMEMPDLDGKPSRKAGLDLLSLIRGQFPLLPLVVMSGTTDQKIALDSIRHFGAMTFIPKNDVAADPAAFLSEIAQIISRAGEVEFERQMRERAATAFRSTLPKEMPTCTGVGGAFFSKSKEAVGGDLHDCAVPKDGELRFLIADAAGKSWPGAMQITRLKAFYHAAGLPDACGLESTASEWNQFIFEQKGPENVHLTLFVGTFDSKSGHLVYCNAGHDPPLVVGHDGAIKTLSATGLPIGSLPGSRYEVGECDLEVGDLLVLYTDGFVESHNSQGAELGVDWLKEAAREARNRSADQVLEDLLATFEGLVDQEGIVDDRTLLVFKREEPGAESATNKVAAVGEVS